MICPSRHICVAFTILPSCTNDEMFWISGSSLSDLCYFDSFIWIWFSCFTEQQGNLSYDWDTLKIGRDVLGAQMVSTLLEFSISPFLVYIIMWHHPKNNITKICIASDKQIDFLMSKPLPNNIFKIVLVCKKKIA